MGIDSPAKGVGGQKPREGSNPSHSAISKSSGIYVPELYFFIRIKFRTCLFRIFSKYYIISPNSNLLSANSFSIYLFDNGMAMKNPPPRAQPLQEGEYHYSIPTQGSVVSLRSTTLSAASSTRCSKAARNLVSHLGTFAPSFTAFSRMLPTLPEWHPPHPGAKADRLP